MDHVIPMVLMSYAVDVLFGFLVVDVVAPVPKSAFLASFLPDDNLAPAIPFGHPFSSIGQAIKNFVPFPDWCAPYHHRIFHSRLRSSFWDLTKTARPNPGPESQRAV